MRSPISMRLYDEKGFTLTELIVIVAIIVILAAISAYSFRDMQERYRAESQIKQMHADIMNARVRATLQNRIFFVTVTQNTYQINEDTDESGGNAPNAADLPMFPSPQSLKFPLTGGSWTGTIVMDAKGIISKSTGAVVASSPIMLMFNTYGSGPEYDCLVLGPTRINIGKSNGADCVPR